MPALSVGRLGLLSLLLSCGEPASEPQDANHLAGTDPCSQGHPEVADACRMAWLESKKGFPYELAEAEWMEVCAKMQTTAYGDLCRMHQSTSEWHLRRAHGEVEQAAVIDRVCVPMSDPLVRAQCTFDHMMSNFVLVLDPASWVRLCLGPGQALAQHCINHGVDNWMAGLQGGTEWPPWFTEQDLVDQVEATVAPYGAPMGDTDLAVSSLHVFLQALAFRKLGKEYAVTLNQKGHQPREHDQFMSDCAKLVGCASLLERPGLTWADEDVRPWWK